MSPHIPDDYVNVAERIRQFKQQYPEGSLQSVKDPYVVEVGDRSFVVYCAAAYRTPDDQRPGIGWAWEPVPGPTRFTRDSELMNVETSAWGRAIVALGFETKQIASSEEVRNRQPEEAEPPAPGEPDPTDAQFVALKVVLAELQEARPPTDQTRTWADEARHFCEQRFHKSSSTQLTRMEMGLLIDYLDECLTANQIPFN